MGLYSPAINTVNVPYGREKQNCIKNATSQLYYLILKIKPSVLRLT